MRRTLCGYIAIVLALTACGGLAADGTEPIAAADQALVSASTVLGFERTWDWSTSTGVKSSSATRTEGAAALAVRNFSYVELTSVPLPSLSGVSSTLALDLKLPTSPAWGQAQLFVSIPSRGVFNAFCGQVPLAGSPANSYREVAFPLPSNIVDALRQSYSDLTIKLVLNVPYTASAYLFDHLHFEGAVPYSKVEMRVSNLDDIIAVSVDGLQRRMWHIMDPVQNERVDVSSWFAGGNHQVRLQGVNVGGPFSFGVELWVDDQLVVNQACPSNLCTGSDAAEGILFDQTYTVATPNRPASQPVQFTSSTPGKLYLDDSYTGLSTPATLTLPQGEYRVGVGISRDEPLDYSGSYYERQLAVGSAPAQVNLTSGQPLPVQRTTSVTILPIRNCYVNPGTDVGVLQNSDVTLLQQQAESTRTKQVLPLSYGMANWNVSVQPMVENVPIYLADRTSPADIYAFLDASGLWGLTSQYDMIVYFYSMHHADGTLLDYYSDYAWGGGGQLVDLSTYWTRGVAGDQPINALLHESLHNYEAYNWSVLGYGGLGGLHGGGQHGYVPDTPNGEVDWMMWNRHFMRGQVAQLAGMRLDIQWPSMPTTADLWVGVFPALRHGG